jgi:hypothetical protein
MWPESSGEVLLLSSTVADEEEDDLDDWTDYSQYASTGECSIQHL